MDSKLSKRDSKLYQKEFPRKVLETEGFDEFFSDGRGWFYKLSCDGIGYAPVIGGPYKTLNIAIERCIRVTVVLREALRSDTMFESSLEESLH